MSLFLKIAAHALHEHDRTAEADSPQPEEVMQ